MKKKLVGILVCTLLMATTVLPVTGIMNIDKTSNDKNIELELRLFDNYNNYIDSYTISTKYLGAGEEWIFSKDIYEKLDIHNFKIHITIK